MIFAVVVSGDTRPSVELFSALYKATGFVRKVLLSRDPNGDDASEELDLHQVSLGWVYRRTLPDGAVIAIRAFPDRDMLADPNS
jgi:hypothetical protein